MPWKWRTLPPVLAAGALWCFPGEPGPARLWGADPSPIGRTVLRASAQVEPAVPGRLTLPGRVPGRVPDAPPAEVTPPSGTDLSSALGGSQSLTGLLGGEVMPIDLGAALHLAGVQNPELLIARQRVVEAVAERQLAAAGLLPSLRAGSSYDDHNGPLQQSSGNILNVNRSSVYVGAGAYAIAAGTVNIPGVYWDLNASDAIFRILVSRRTVEQQQFHSQAVELQMMGRVALAYNELLRSVGRRAVLWQNQQNAQEVVRLTEAYAESGLGSEADADRARSELAALTAEVREAEGQVLIASAGLAELLSLDPSVQLCPAEERYVPMPLVPDPIPLCELLAIALVQRPEMAERQTAVQGAMLTLRGAKMLPFSPNMIVAFSAGGEGGGSNLVASPAGSTPFARSDPRFGKFKGRQDFDAIAYWMLKNLGFGNVAQIREAESRLNASHFEVLAEMDRVRAEVARGYARTHARFAQIVTAEQAVRSATTGYEEDTRRITGGQGLPIELFDDLRLLARSRETYLKAIVDYNAAQLQLYVALGNPPAGMLARPAIDGSLSPVSSGSPVEVLAPAPEPAGPAQ